MHKIGNKAEGPGMYLYIRDINLEKATFFNAN